MASSASETSIANAALTLLGERRIDSIDGTSRTAKLVKERYSEVRDETLRAHPWNFAETRAEIAVSATAPVWGFDNLYPFPEDLLRLLNVNNPSGERWSVEGRAIVTDLGSPLQIIYTKQVVDPLQMDSLFRQALAARMAWELAESITGTNSKVEELARTYQAKLQSARTPDGQEPSPAFVEAGEWLDSREAVGFVGRIPSGEGTPL